MNARAENNLIGTEVVRGRVRSEWIDINDHMNVAYYVLAFDLGVDALWREFGLTDDYIREQQGSTFAVESHLTWQREISEGEPYIVTSQVLAYDTKRIHQFMRMYHGSEYYLAATAEWMNLHVDIRARRVAPWPQAVLARIAAFVEQQPAVDWPDEAGRRMHIEKPLFSVRDGK